MENAVKALLFAGRLLLALLLISLAMYVFNTIRSSKIYSVMDEQNLRAYNRPFDLYDGDNNVSGSNLKTLFNKIIEHNKNYEEDNSRWINVIVRDGEEFDSDLHDNRPTNEAIDFDSLTVEEYNNSIFMILKAIWTVKRYEVYCSYDTRTGMIACIQFREVVN